MLLLLKANFPLHWNGLSSIKVIFTTKSFVNWKTPTKHSVVNHHGKRSNSLAPQLLFTNQVKNFLRLFFGQGADSHKTYEH
jgi:hypothetical protein